jgi:hypothetical protein
MRDEVNANLGTGNFLVIFHLPTAYFILVSHEDFQGGVPIVVEK